MKLKNNYLRLTFFPTRFFKKFSKNFQKIFKISRGKIFITYKL